MKKCILIVIAGLLWSVPGAADEDATATATAQPAEPDPADDAPDDVSSPDDDEPDDAPDDTPADPSDDDDAESPTDDVAGEGTLEPEVIVPTPRAPTPAEPTTTPPATAPPAPEEPPAKEATAADTPDEGTVLLGSLLGCALGTAPPLAGTALGIGIGVCAFQQGSMANDPVAGCVVALFGALLGVLIAVPSALAYGPCSSIGTLVGASIHGLVAGRGPWGGMLGSLPGVVLGFTGTVGAIVGLSYANDNNEEFPLINGAAPGLGWSIALGALTLAALAGPIAVLGAVWLDIVARDEPEPAPQARARVPAVRELPPALSHKRRADASTERALAVAY